MAHSAHLTPAPAAQEVLGSPRRDQHGGQPAAVAAGRSPAGLERPSVGRSGLERRDMPRYRSGPPSPSCRAGDVRRWLAVGRVAQVRRYEEPPGLTGSGPRSQVDVDCGAWAGSADMCGRPRCFERTSVGLDVHARSIAGCGVDTVTGQVTRQRLVPTGAPLRCQIGRQPLPGRAGVQIARASSVNAAATRSAGRASTPSS